MFVQQPGATTIEHTPVGSATLTPGATQIITTSGGTLLGWKIASNGTNIYLVALVDIAGTSTMKLINLGTSVPASIDLSQGTDLGPYAGTIRSFEVSDARATVVADTGNTETHYFGSVLP